jgi:hypothetical protein
LDIYRQEQKQLDIYRQEQKQLDIYIVKIMRKGRIEFY